MDAGAARIDITPDRPICMAGYSARTAHSEGIYHSLYAKALVLEENGVRGVVLTTDLIGFDDVTCEAVKTGIGEALGLGPEDILLTASHTHTGPEMRLGSHKYVDEFDEEYARALVDRLVAVAAQAADELEPVTVAFGTVSCTLGVNRRLPTPEGVAMRPNPAGKTDPVAGVLSVNRSEGDPVAIVMRYACHPTTLGGYLIGADYPGYAQDYVEEVFSRFRAPVHSRLRGRSEGAARGRQGIFQKWAARRSPAAGRRTRARGARGVGRGHDARFRRPENAIVHRGITVSGAAAARTGHRDGRQPGPVSRGLGARPCSKGSMPERNSPREECLPSRPWRSAISRVSRWPARCVWGVPCSLRNF